MGLLGLLMSYYGGLEGILSGLAKSTDHPSAINRVSENERKMAMILVKMKTILMLITTMKLVAVVAELKNNNDGSTDAA